MIKYKVYFSNNNNKNIKIFRKQCFNKSEVSDLMNILLILLVSITIPIEVEYIECCMKILIEVEL